MRGWQEGQAGLRAGRLRLAEGLGTQDAAEPRGTLPSLGPPDPGADRRGAQPCSLGPEEACSALSSASVARPPVLCGVGSLPGLALGPSSRNGVRVRARVCPCLMLDRGSGFGFLLFPGAPSAVLELSSAGQGPCPMPTFESSSQACSLRCVAGPYCSGAWGWGVGEGSVQRGPHPHPQRLPSPVLTQALSSPLINRPGTAPLMVSLATFPQVSLPSPPKPSSSKAL